MKKIILILNSGQIFKVLLIVILILLTSVFEVLLLLFIQPLLQVFLNFQAISYNFKFFSLNYNVDARILFLCFVSIFFLRNFFFALTSVLKNQFITNLHINISNKIYSSYLNRNYFFFLKNNSSKLISNVINEVNFFCYNVFDSFLIFLTEIFLILAIIFFYFLIF